MVVSKYSWAVYDDIVAVKHTDKSVFKNRGSVIPQEFRSFFDIDDMEPGDTRRIKFIFEGTTYNGKFERIRSTTRITRVFWDSKLSTAFNAIFPNVIETRDYPYLQFTKQSRDCYELSFPGYIDFEQGQAEIGAECLENEVIIKGPEGERTMHYVTRYERNPRLRKKAIELHGTKCMACGFDFEKRYGERGRNYIEVHHVVPLSSTDGPVDVDPETDLVCVCSNCHRMIHRSKDKVLTLDELKAIVNSR